MSLAKRNRFGKLHRYVVIMLWNGNECGKTTVVRISRQTSPLQIMKDKKKTGECKIFQSIG
jgi:hypothetical protein